MNSQDNSVLSLYHKATKKIEYFDMGLQQQVQPSAPNGYKFELFVQAFMSHVPAGQLGVF